MQMNNLEWFCHVCHDLRPDVFISVYVRPTEIAGVAYDERIRYCNDRPVCIEAAHTFTMAELEQARYVAPVVIKAPADPFIQLARLRRISRAGFVTMMAVVAIYAVAILVGLAFPFGLRIALMVIGIGGSVVNAYCDHERIRLLVEARTSLYERP